MSAVIYPDDLKIMAEKLNAQLQHDNTIHNENRLICKNGKIKWVSIKAQLFTEEDGQEVLLLCICGYYRRKAASGTG